MSNQTDLIQFYWLADLFTKGMADDLNDWWPLWQTFFWFFTQSFLPKAWRARIKGNFCHRALTAVQRLTYWSNPLMFNLTRIANWHGGGFKSKPLSSTVFPLHLKSVKWQWLRSWFFRPHTMYKLITLSSELGLKAVEVRRFTLCQFVPSPQISTCNERDYNSLVSW